MMISTIKQVLVKEPSRTMVHGISSHPQLGKPDFDKALVQHRAYVAALRQCGVNVTVLDADPRFPDSCFIEDTAVCTEHLAVITRPGAPSRLEEPAAVADVLKQHYDRVETIQAPGTLEGGDVMMVQDHCYIGLSRRTNRHGARQLLDILKGCGMSGSMVPLREMLHLKTGLAYLEDGVLLVAGEFVGNPLFESYTTVVVPEAEAYAANAIRVNHNVLIPAGYPETQERLRRMGLNTIAVDTSEFRKLDGGLSCLSLRF